jgi:hypothetical protein
MPCDVKFGSTVSILRSATNIEGSELADMKIEIEAIAGVPSKKEAKADD